MDRKIKHSLLNKRIIRFYDFLFSLIILIFLSPLMIFTFLICLLESSKPIFVQTRVGENSRILFCGDARQSDLTKTNDRNGIVDFLNILRKMSSFDIIEFGIDDIVRSGLVKEYLTAKIELGM